MAMWTPEEVTRILTDHQRGSQAVQRARQMGLERVGSQVHESGRHLITMPIDTFEAILAVLEEDFGR